MTNLTDVRLSSRRLTDDERLAFLADKAASYDAMLRQMRDECNGNPALMTTYGFASAQHAPTVGLMAYMHDDVRRASCEQIRDEITNGRKTWR